MTDRGARARRALGDATSIVVKAPNWIGDAVMATPTLAALRAGCPQARITVLAKPHVAETLAHHPAVDAVVVEALGRTGWMGRLRLARLLREQRFDVALLLTNSFGSALDMALARVPCRIGYRTDGRALWLTVPIPRPPQRRAPHMTVYYLNLLAPWHIPGDPKAVQVVVTTEEREAARKRLLAWGVDPAVERLIGVNPGAAYGSAKQWPAPRVTELARRLVRDGARVLVIGSRSERALGRAIAEGLQPAAINAAGETTVREAMALMTWCRRMVTNDSGPMHLAAALGVPVTAVFGPTDARVTGPVGRSATVIQRDVECAPCRYRECPIDHACMSAVSVDEVYGSAHS